MSYINWTFPVASARVGVDMFAGSFPATFGGPMPIDRHGQPIGGPHHVPLRALMPSYEATRRQGLPSPPPEEPHLGEFYRRFGFQIRLVAGDLRLNAMIVDRLEAMVTEVTVQTGVESFGATFKPRIVREPEAVEALQRHFDSLWGAADPIELLHNRIPELINRAGQRLIATVSDTKWGPVIRKLAENPRDLFELAPRRFEELVAELLSSRGFDVRLTPQTRDGGFDIFAFLDSEAGRQLYLVECKRNARHRPVDVTIVRALYGVVEQQKSTGGMIVTTSRFSSDALTLVGEEHTYRMSLKEYADVVEWLRDYAHVSG